MAEVTEITLGEKKFGIQRLTIGQLLDLNAIQMVGSTMAMSIPKIVRLQSKINELQASGGADDNGLNEMLAILHSPDTAADQEKADVNTRRMGQRMIDTVSTALSKVAPEMTPEVIADTEMTYAELNAAYTAVLVHAGLIMGEPKGSP
jgi:hypothetical protein